MKLILESEIYATIGEDGFRRLVRGFYSRIPADPVIGPMYPINDLEGAEKRLRDFLIFRFGGPQTYIAERGHPRLRMRHAPFPITFAARNAWVKLMDAAFEEAQLPEQVVAVLKPFMANTATFMMNRDG